MIHELMGGWFRRCKAEPAALEIIFFVICIDIIDE
jgi:hypothetical protein